MCTAVLSCVSYHQPLPEFPASFYVNPSTPLFMCHNDLKVFAQNLPFLGIYLLRDTRVSPLPQRRSRHHKQSSMNCHFSFSYRLKALKRLTHARPNGSYILQSTFSLLTPGVVFSQRQIDHKTDQYMHNILFLDKQCNVSSA